MLVLTRTTGRRVVITTGAGERIVVTILGTARDRARLGFDAPPGVVIDREEIDLLGREGRRDRDDR